MSRYQGIFGVAVAAGLTVFFACDGGSPDDGAKTAAIKPVPVLSVMTPGETEITSKEDWVKGAVLSLSGAADEGWDFSAVTASIRGRGNSTWAQPKKPYALKLDK
ncbi:MAG: hypothetical protein K2I74_07235, partial [Treponemataceae bacterium]|nr:hypothetical protein [Treponemataceae bacterium]